MRIASFHVLDNPEVQQLLKQKFEKALPDMIERYTSCFQRVACWIGERLQKK